MSKTWRAIVLLTVAWVLAAACTPGGAAVTETPTSAVSVRRGGVLYLAAVRDVSAAFDPQKAHDRLSLEFFRCCLLRTLFSTSGLPAAQGGSDLQPDLASGPARVTDDGLTWTIAIKPGLRYAPPFAGTEITSGDIVRALEREADQEAGVSGSASNYSVITGFDDFRAGRASSIVGLSTPDDHTLVLQLREPAGDLGWRLALPAAAPIPPLGGDPLGAAAGHTTDYGRFLVASGPYMFDGSPALDPSGPAKAQIPVAGYVPGRSIKLVRNPSWRSSTDSLRPAYASGIDVSIGGSTEGLYQKVESGVIDLVLDAPPPADMLELFATDPALQTRLFVNLSGTVDFVAMNLAAPPFDDIHVRRAFNWVMDKAAAVTLAGGSVAGIPAAHIFPDGTLGEALQTYDYYATPGQGGDVGKAKAEMARSRYAGQDGLCHAPECNHVLALTSTGEVAAKIATLVQQDLAQIGITLDVSPLEPSAEASRCADPSTRVRLCLSVGWTQGYPDAYSFAQPLFSSSSLFPACCNYSILGATPAELLRWGYQATTVPSVDDRLKQCASAVVGDNRTACWADLDRLLMEDLVPWVPWMVPRDDAIVSSHITNFSFDELAGMVALDRVATSRTT